MKKKLTASQKRLIVCAISLGIFALSYFYVYMRFQDMTLDVQAKTGEVRQQISERENQIENQDKIKQETQELKLQEENIINSYPVYLAKEDNFMFVEELQDKLKIKITSINPSDSILLYETTVPAVKTGSQPTKEYDPTLEISSDYMMGLQSTISLSFQTTYEGFKKLVNYINQYPEKTVINDVSVSYDNSTGNLSGSLNITRFALTGTGKVYEPPYISDISIGTDNIFGTIEIKPNKKSQNGQKD